MNPNVLEALVGFNLQLLAQAGDVARRWQAAGPAAASMGPQLRHIVEHYQCLVAGAHSGAVDYDARARERALETEPLALIERLGRIAMQLRNWHGLADRPLRVTQHIGLDGGGVVAVDSTLARELQFVASHTVHHFAMLRSLLASLPGGLDPDFGKAPGTIAHERERVAA